MLSFFPFLGIGAITLGIYAVYDTIKVCGSDDLTFALLLLASLSVVASCLFYLTWCYACICLAEFRFEARGIVVKYPLFRPQLIPWDEFQEVCVIYSAYTTRGVQKANTIICCVKKGEKKDFYDRWKTENPFKYRSLLGIAYAPELHQGIEEKYPYTVLDLRETMAYRLRYKSDTD